MQLAGSTFIRNAITSTTFKTTPDVPFTSFQLTLPQGRYSALTANVNLCATRLVAVKKRVTVHRHGRTIHPLRAVKQRVPATLAMPTELVAQNGLQIHQRTRITVTGCPKPRSHEPSGPKKRRRSHK